MIAMCASLDYINSWYCSSMFIVHNDVFIYNGSCFASFLGVAAVTVHWLDNPYSNSPCFAFSVWTLHELFIP